MGYSDYYNSAYATASTSAGYDDAAMVALAGFFLTYMVVIIAIAIVQIVAMWKLFTKAGEKGWKAIIPIYNAVILFRISGLSPWLILLSIIPFVGWIAMIAVTAVLCARLAKSFGKDGGWAVGLFFLAPIFYMILAFGSSEYIGPNGEQKELKEE